MRIRNVISAAALLLSATFAGAAEAPRYVFYFIGDGMGLGHVNAAQSYNRMVLGNDAPLLMMQFPVNSVATTYSANAPVTDSAAAGTALATGQKTKNSMLGMNPDSMAVNSIAADLFAKGWGVGVVTSVAPDDATPAAFYAHQPNRGMFYEIGKDAVASGYEFIAGSNLRGTRKKDGTSTGLLEMFAEAGVDVVRGTEAAAASKSRRVVMLNTDSLSGSNIGYTIDSIPGVLTLPAMTKACLSHLEKTSPDRFFMMVEGGNIDHAAHANDGGGTIKEILNFNEALQVAYGFYLKHPDETLIVVTADHDSGAMAFDFRSNCDLRTIDSQRVSKDRFSDWCKGLLKSRRTFTWDDMREYLADNLGFWRDVPLSDAETDILKAAFDKTFEQRNSADQKTLYNSFNEFAVAVYNIANRHAGLSFTSNSHSGNMVPVYAIGVDAGMFNGMNDNTDLPKKILKIALGN